MSNVRCYVKPLVIVFVLAQAAVAQALAVPPTDLCPNVADILDTTSFPLDSPPALVQGQATVDFTIRVDGSVVDPVVNDVTDTAFSAPALALVARLSCKPQITSVRARLPISFRRPATLTPYLCRNYAAVMHSVAYPKEAALQGIEKGEVIMEFTLSPTGGISNLRALRFSHEVFAVEALLAMQRLECSGTGKQVQVRVPFAFRLE